MTAVPDPVVVTPSVSPSPVVSPSPADRGAPGPRDGYLDLLRAAALARVVAYHTVGWIWLPVAFPSMGLMFAIAGSLMAASLDRAGPRAVVDRLRRLLPPFWAYAAVAVAVLVATGWRVGIGFPWYDAVWWALPVRVPPAGVAPWARSLTIFLWYIVTYLWLVLLSPMLAWAVRRWSGRTFAVALAVPAWFVVGSGHVTGFFVASYAACWVLGMAHHDGVLDRIPVRRYATGVVVLAIAGGGWVLVAAVTTPTFDLTSTAGGNTLWSVAVAAAALRWRPRLDRLWRNGSARRVVALLNARAVTVYLWHVPAGLLAVTMLRAARVSGPAAVVLHVAGVIVGTGAAVLGLGWVEDLAARRRPALVPALAAIRAGAR
jgi:peptidoglycan/LPS O-acetylase OafA/YrhL